MNQNASQMLLWPVISGPMGLQGNGRQNKQLSIHQRPLKKSAHGDHFQMRLDMH